MNELPSPKNNLLPVYLVTIDELKTGKSLKKFVTTKKPNITGATMEFQGFQLPKDLDTSEVKSSKDLFEKTTGEALKSQELIYPLDRVVSVENLSYQNKNAKQEK